MSDRLALAHAIEEAGVERAKAEAVATAIARFVEGSAATKTDVDRAEAVLRAEVAECVPRSRGSPTALVPVCVWRREEEGARRRPPVAA